MMQISGKTPARATATSSHYIKYKYVDLICLVSIFMSAHAAVRRH